MKKVQLIDFITKEFHNKPYIYFAFLSGDMILDDYDEGAIIDYHIGVASQVDDQIIEVLDSFDQVLHIKKTKKVITCVYDNGEVINIHKESYNEVITPKKYAKLFDKTNILENSSCKLGKLTDLQISDLVNEYSLDLYKFVLSYKSKDILYLMELVNKLQKSLTLFLVYLSNDTVSNYDIKGKLELLDKKYAIEVAKIIKEYKYNTLLQTAQLYTLMLVEVTKTLKFEIGQNVNYDLLNFAKKGLFSL